MADVVHSQLVLKAVARLFAVRKSHHSGVVEEDMKRPSLVEYCGAEVFDRGQGGEVQQGGVAVGQGDGGARGGGGADGGQGRPGLDGVAAAEDDVVAPGRQRLGRDEADARVGARDEDGLVLLVLVVAVVVLGGGLRLDDGRRRSAPGVDFCWSPSSFFFLERVRCIRSSFSLCLLLLCESLASLSPSAAAHCATPLRDRGRLAERSQGRAHDCR